MKTAAAAALLLFAASADAAAHSNHCYDPPCGLHLCTGKNGVADMAAEWDKQVAANKGPANGNSTSLQPPKTGNATVKHEPRQLPKEHRQPYGRRLLRQGRGLC